MTSALSAVKHKVTVLHEGSETILEVSENTSILEAALDAGIKLPHDCKLGVCLTCPSKIISGQVDQDGSTLDDSVMEAGYALTCMTFPRSDVVITSIDEEELVSAQFSGR
ncbi:2Fe-2S ferredoxin-type domain-containing protein [Ochromonadaceae sp. CCMP2298]|nr:2Fe-2S ferredoxin-type domain-containing protein [Ochromonadaceae sp. CCMP2298]